MKLELFHKWLCPYSAKVRDFIASHGLENKISYVDISENENFKKQLMKLTGKTQVPCLVINGIPMLESDDIIEWLKTNLSADQSGDLHT